MIKKLCLRFKDRAEAQGYKGVKRDRAALEFFCGAVAALDAVNPDSEEAKQLLSWTTWSVGLRGYSAIEEKLKES